MHRVGGGALHPTAEQPGQQHEQHGAGQHRKQDESGARLEEDPEEGDAAGRGCRQRHRCPSCGAGPGDCGDGRTAAPRRPRDSRAPSQRGLGWATVETSGSSWPSGTEAAARRVIGGHARLSRFASPTCVAPGRRRAMSGSPGPEGACAAQGLRGDQAIVALNFLHQISTDFRALRSSEAGIT